MTRHIALLRGAEWKDGDPRPRVAGRRRRFALGLVMGGIHACLGERGDSDGLRVGFNAKVLPQRASKVLIGEDCFAAQPHVDEGSQFLTVGFLKIWVYAESLSGKEQAFSSFKPGCRPGQKAQHDLNCHAGEASTFSRQPLFKIGQICCPIHQQVAFVKFNCLPQVIEPTGFMMDGESLRVA